MPKKLRALLGIEVESLPDYHGQPALGVYYPLHPYRNRWEFNPIYGAYNTCVAEGGEISITTDATRLINESSYPKRTGIEIRSMSPETGMNEQVLHITKAFSIWIDQQKRKIRQENAVKKHKHPERFNHYLEVSDFISY